MSISDELEKYDEEDLPTISKKSNLVKKSEVDIRINRIKQNIRMYNNCKIDIVRDLQYLKENQKQLIDEKGVTFKEFIEQELKLSTSYFYEQIQAYNLCLEYHQPEVFNDVDYKLLVKLSRLKDHEKQEDLFNNITNLSRKDIDEKVKSDSTDVQENNVININIVRPADSEEKQTVAAEEKKTIDVKTEDYDVVPTFDDVIKKIEVYVKSQREELFDAEKEYLINMIQKIEIE